jgi:hypothetical protein
VVKDMARGTTKWRGHEKAAEALYEAAGGDLAALEEMYRDDLAERLDIVIEHVGWEAVVLVLYEERMVESALSAQARKALPKGAFVFPGERRYPIHDLAHARNALARCSGKPEEGKVKAAVFARYPKLKSGSALHEEIIRLAGLYAVTEGERNGLDWLLDYVDSLAEFSLRGKFTEAKHKRGRKGTSQGGKFVSSGGGGLPSIGRKRRREKPIPGDTGWDRKPGEPPPGMRYETPEERAARHKADAERRARQTGDRSETAATSKPDEKKKEMSDYERERHERFMLDPEGNYPASWTLQQIRAAEHRRKQRIKGRYRSGTEMHQFEGEEHPRPFRG